MHISVAGEYSDTPSESTTATDTLTELQWWVECNRSTTSVTGSC